MKNSIILYLVLVLFTTTKTTAQRNTVPKIDYYKQLVGKWEGTGFVTDAYGVRQDVNATQWVSISNNMVVANGIFENSATGFKADFLKKFYFNTKLQDWRANVYVEKKYYLTTDLSLSDNYTLIYTFKDEQGMMNRATIYAAFPYGWTEMLETWTGQEWDIKRRVIMRKLPPTKVQIVPKPLRKTIVEPARKAPF